MFVAIADISLRPGAEDEFVRSFSDANADLSGCAGFVARRLLKSGDGSFKVIVEHDSRETFEKMHQSDVHSKWHGIMTTYMERPPSPRFFQVVA